jgi:hypothetical protein
MQRATDRLIGRKEILWLMENMYGISSWSGARMFIKREGLPLHRLGDKPMLCVSEVIQHENRKGRTVSINNLTILK